MNIVHNMTLDDVRNTIVTVLLTSRGRRREQGLPPLPGSRPASDLGVRRIGVSNLFYSAFCLLFYHSC